MLNTEDTDEDVLYKMYDIQRNVNTILRLTIEALDSDRREYNEESLELMKAYLQKSFDYVFKNMETAYSEAMTPFDAFVNQNKKFTSEDKFPEFFGIL
jgi:hypothetical protein